MACRTNQKDRVGTQVAQTYVRRAPTARNTGRNGRRNRCEATQLREAMTPSGGKPAGCFYSDIRCANDA